MKVTYKKLKENIFVKYPNRVFIETGTYIGDSVQMALDAGFEKIYSIELSKKYYKIAKGRFNYFKNVEIIHGDSSEILSILIKNIKEPITFWLDAHYSKGDTAIGKYCSPLMMELEQIRKTGIKNHTIMIDDIRCWDKQSDTKPVCNCPKYPCNNFYGFYTGDLISMLKEINPHYDLIYEDHDVPDDILVAYPDKYTCRVISTGKIGKFIEQHPITGKCIVNIDGELINYDHNYIEMLNYENTDRTGYEL